MQRLAISREWSATTRRIRWAALGAIAVALAASLAPASGATGGKRVSGSAGNVRFVFKLHFTTGKFSDIGTFKASGAIVDAGIVRTQVVQQDPLKLRRVLKGANGSIALLLDATQAVSTGVRFRWHVGSGSGKYKGLGGRGPGKDNFNAAGDLTGGLFTGSVRR